MPSYLSDFAKSQWRLYAPILRKRDDVNDQDWAWLELYCQNYAIYRQSMHDIEEHGLFLMMNANKTRGQNPAFKVLTEAQKLMIKFGALLADKLPIDTKRDPLDELME
ncbi:P27 family phage terminase small subunit [Glaciecola petra]|uniref:P27 family phage terminase small subunit n=1 Tax=Glaciecola petra TaxID=3075602 RepID=A0ABU2ZQD7_9ALTE|nr:P27 family phage terminase small subunit [Aestuariibacter sp. P117]MDT0594549.1 P27 family phage terminase small subunit [Aestuariibacter sp. P117]